MDIISKVVKRIKNKGVLDTLGLAIHIIQGLADYYLNPFAKRQSRFPKPDYEKIRKDLETSGLEVIPYKVNRGNFYHWLKGTNFPKEYIDSYGEVFVEKALEYYVGAQLLKLQKGDVLIDVAAAHSPWFEIAEHMYGCSAYALDLLFPPGIDGKKIGADATTMPLADGFATKMALHCAYETFEGDADIRLLPEAYRVLAGGVKW